jgi:hypothetical protein
MQVYALFVSIRRRVAYQYGSSPWAAAGLCTYGGQREFAGCAVDYSAAAGSTTIDRMRVSALPLHSLVTVWAPLTLPVCGMKTEVRYPRESGASVTEVRPILVATRECTPLLILVRHSGPFSLRCQRALAPSTVPNAIEYRSTQQWLNGSCGGRQRYSRPIIWIKAAATAEAASTDRVLNSAVGHSPQLLAGHSLTIANICCTTVSHAQSGALASALLQHWQTLKHAAHTPEVFGFSRTAKVSTEALQRGQLRSRRHI